MRSPLHDAQAALARDYARRIVRAASAGPAPAGGLRASVLLHEAFLAGTPLWMLMCEWALIASHRCLEFERGATELGPRREFRPPVPPEWAATSKWAAADRWADAFADAVVARDTAAIRARLQELSRLEKPRAEAADRAAWSLICTAVESVGGASYNDIVARGGL